jgi:NADPH:quinone reductase-like Zn-dependent oxidoreductase
MRAIVHDRYGPPDILRVDEVAQPFPKNDEIRVRVHAATVSRSDCALRAGEPWMSRAITGIRRPKRRILGSDLAGEVDAVGAKVSEFAVGDRVFGVNAWKFGTHAEFMCMRADAAVAIMPDGMSFENASAICDGAILALNALRPARIRKGQSVLVYGASGSIGTAGVQLARAFGGEVTAVCTTRNFDLVRSLGAGECIDYMLEDFTRNGRTYDVILDAYGKLLFKRCRDSLTRNGAFVATDHLPNLALAMWTARVGSKKVLFPIPPKFTKRDVLFVKQLIEAGKYRAVIDRVYPLEQVVDATRYVEQHQKTGNVVLAIS